MNHKGMLYLMVADDQSFMKLGFTRKPGQRLNEVRYACRKRYGGQRTVELAALVHGTSRDETDLKRRFGAGGNKSEWLPYSPSLVREFARFPSVGPEGSVVRLNIRVSPALHERIRVAAAKAGLSVQGFIEKTLTEAFSQKRS